MSDRLGSSGIVAVLALLAMSSLGPAFANDGDPWWSDARERILAAEYEITWQEHPVLEDLDAAWHAPNREHDLRAYFTPAGVHVVRRTASEPSWELRLSLVAHGRGAKTLPVGDATLSTRGNRIDYDRAAIVEWYVNDPRGLEQGFTLAGPPPDLEPETSPVVLVLALGGSLSPVISADGQAIDFTGPGGARVLRYASLAVVDAGGRELPARMEGFAHAGVRGIRITFDDRGAAYPVTVDPLITSPAWTATGQQSSEYFGRSVSTAGDVNGDGYSDVIVGSSQYDNGQLNEGRAFVFHGSPAGLGAIAAWTAESDQVNASFGVSVSTAGDVNGDGYADVIIGAWNYDNGVTDEGGAFVYHGSPSGLGSLPVWIVDGDQPGAHAGGSVSTAGDVNGDGYSDVAVGAYLFNFDETDEGRVRLYHGAAAGLSTLPAWTADGNQPGASFGTRVSTAGDVNGDGYSDLVVGAPHHDPCPGFPCTDFNVDAGRAYVFHGSAGGLSPTASWYGEGHTDGVGFGTSVSTAGDVNGDGYADVVVGGPLYDHGEAEEGGAWLYLGSPAGLDTAASWMDEGDQTIARFGVAVSTAGDVDGDGYADVIVGANQYSNDQEIEGRAFVYRGSAAGLGPAAAWTLEGNSSAHFAASVSAAGDVNGDGYGDIIIGAPFQFDGVPDAGRAYVFHGSTAGLGAAAVFGAESDQAGAGFGISVSDAGDVNGDGFSDVIVGADQFDNGETDEGRAYLFHGSPNGLQAAADWTAESDQTDARFGRSVSAAGDVNGDGYGDVIVGAYGYNHGGQIDAGRAFVYHGSPAGLGSAAAWSAGSDQGSALFGRSVSTAGDVNGDGYADVVVGAHLYDDVSQDEGRAFVYHGSPVGLAEEPAWSAGSGLVAAEYGSAVSTAGDVNGDGYSDVVVGAHAYDVDGWKVGRVYVYHGSVGGLSATADWTAESEPGGSLFPHFGAAVSMAGDVNGDGYADVLVGAHAYDNGADAEGRAYVFQGSAAGLGLEPDWIAESDQALAMFGISVSTAGDLDADGYSDVIVGAWTYDNGQPSEGGAFVYHGSQSGLSTVPDWIAESDQSGATLGVSVSTAGDVNGDGYADVIVGASFHDNGEVDEGRAAVYYGGGGGGLSVAPRQLQPYDDVPIAPLGRSQAPDRFRLGVLGRSPFGGGRAKLEWEAKAAGTLFDGEDTGTTGSWLDLAGGAVELTETVDGLPGDTPLHWRVRLRYDPASTPHAQFSRWIRVPDGGWNETDLRTFGDGDGVAHEFDCDDADAGVWSIPSEAVALVVSADKETFSWNPPQAPGGLAGGLRYDLLRSPRPGDFVTETDCVASGISMTTATDGATPGPGGLAAYLARAVNACPQGAGSLGRTSAGAERAGRTCP